MESKNSVQLEADFIQHADWSALPYSPPWSPTSVGSSEWCDKEATTDEGSDEDVDMPVNQVEDVVDIQQLEDISSSEDSMSSSSDASSEHDSGFEANFGEDQAAALLDAALFDRLMAVCPPMPSGEKLLLIHRLITLPLLQYLEQ